MNSEPKDPSEVVLAKWRAYVDAHPEVQEMLAKQEAMGLSRDNAERVLLKVWATFALN